MWKLWGCMLSVQEDAITKSGHLDDHDIGTCENVARQKALELFDGCNRKVCSQTLLVLWGC
jgi:hypothetical protein